MSDVSEETDRAIVQQYLNTTQFSDLLDLNVQYLQGQLPCTIWHAGPLNAESRPLRRLLIAINQAQLLTVSSQPGHEWQPKRMRGRLYKQRAYLEGFLLRSHVPYFKTWAQECGYWYIITDHESEYLSVHADEIEGAQRSGSEIAVTLRMPSPGAAATVETKANVEFLNRLAEFHSPTHTSTAYEGLKNHTVYITVIHPKFTAENHLFENLLQFLQGMRSGV